MKELPLLGLSIVLGSFSYVLFFKPILFIRFAEFFGTKLDEDEINSNLETVYFGKYMVLVFFIAVTIILLMSLIDSYIYN